MKYLIPVVIIVLALLGANSIYVVNEGHAAALTRLGRLEAAGIGPGLHFKVPFIERVTVYDTRAIVVQSQPEDYKTADDQSVRIGFYLRWRVSDPDRFFRATSGNGLHVTDRVTPTIREALRAQVAKHDLSELLASDGGDIDNALQNAVAGDVRKKLGVEILDVGMRRIMPPDAMLQSVYKRMTSEAKARAAAIRARGDAAAAAIRAKGDRAERKLVEAANKDAAVDRGQGDVAAAKVYAKASAQDPRFFRYWSTLNTWRKTFAAGGAVVVLDKGSPFMQAIDPGTASGEATPNKR